MSAERPTLSERLRRSLAENGLVLLFALIIALCAIYAPTEAVQFIYAEF